MDQRYITLFREIAHSTQILAETVKTSEYKDKTEESDRAAALLSDDFQTLYEKLQSDSFTLTRPEYAKLLVGATIVVGSLQTQIKTLTDAAEGYKTQIIPQLQRVFEESTDDETANQLAEEIFKITT